MLNISFSPHSVRFIPNKRVINHPCCFSIFKFIVLIMKVNLAANPFANSLIDDLSQKILLIFFIKSTKRIQLRWLHSSSVDILPIYSLEELVVHYLFFVFNAHPMCWLPDQQPLKNSHSLRKFDALTRMRSLASTSSDFGNYNFPPWINSYISGISSE